MLKYTQQQLLQYQSLPLHAKILHAQKRIESFLTAVDGMAYISYSGGKDSAVLAHVVHTIDKSIPCVFCNTGMESASILQYVRAQQADGLAVTWLHPAMAPRDVFLHYGYPYPSKENAQKIYEAIKGNNNRCLDRTKPFSLPQKWRYLLTERAPVSHKCCDILKKQPFRAYERATGRSALVGTQAQESRLRQRAWERHGCLNLGGKRKTASPLAIWTEQDILRYIKDNDIPLASIYGELIEAESGELQLTGVHRTGCVGCLFGYRSNTAALYSFTHLQKLEPKRYAMLMRATADGGYGYREFLDRWLYENYRQRE